MNDELIADLKRMGRLLLDSAITIEHLERDCSMAHKLLEEGTEIPATSWDDWIKKVNDYLMRV